MKTVFITGSSSGIGRETAKLFQRKGWNVIATMREPKKEQELNKLPNVKVIKCDVTDTDSIKYAVDETIKCFGKIDVLVNNAGFYTIGPLEMATKDQIRRQIDTNLVGLIETTKEVVPYLRKEKGGTIINVSSIAGLTTVPMQTLYHASKWGVEGFSESLQYELRKFNIRVKIIEPGVIKTDFYGRSMTIMNKDNIKDYKSYASRVIDYLVKNGNNGSDASAVAETIYKAASDNKKKIHYPTGKSKNLIMIRKMLPLPIFRKLIQATME